MDTTAILATCLANLSERYTLLYIDQGDRLSTDQCDALARQDWSALDDSFMEWESDAKTTGAESVAEDVVRDALRDVVADEDGFVSPSALDDALSEFRYTNEWDTLREVIYERDDSNALRDLARNTPAILMRSLVVHEDDAWSFSDPTPADIVSGFLSQLESGSVFPINEHNERVIRDTLVEVTPESSVVLGMIVYAVDPVDLVDITSTHVDVVNPYLYLGNPFAGTGFVSEEPLDATFRFERDDLRTDRDSFGYSWTEIAGPVVSAFTAEIREASIDNESE
jgi:hypothetical protein